MPRCRRISAGRVLPSPPDEPILVASGPAPDANRHLGVDMVKRHPYHAVLGVLGVMAVCLFVAGMIGQYDDGPWGGLPGWLGALTWFGFLASVLVIVVLSVYLLLENLKWRKEHDAHGPHTA